MLGPKLQTIPFLQNIQGRGRWEECPGIPLAGTSHQQGSGEDPGGLVQGGRQRTAEQGWEMGVGWGDQASHVPENSPGLEGRAPGFLTQVPALLGDSVSSSVKWASLALPPHPREWWRGQNASWCACSGLGWAAGP